MGPLLGKNKLVGILKKLAWHPSIGGVVGDICSSCPRCQYYKVAPLNVAPPILKIEGGGPFKLLAVDLLSLPLTRKGHIGCLVSVDHFTKWAVIVPIKNKRADTVAAALEDRVFPALPRIPERILSDNGPEFIAEVVADVLQKYGVQHVFSTPYKPSSNGAVERLNRTIIEMVRCTMPDGVAWDEVLSRTVINYNNSVHASLGMTPSECILAESYPGDVQPIISEEVPTWRAGHACFSSFAVGDQVLRKVPLVGNLSVNKLKPRYEGPYRVIKVNANRVTYVLEDRDGHSCRAHHSQLRGYHIVPEYLRQHPLYAKVVKGWIPRLDGWGSEDPDAYETDSESSVSSAEGVGQQRRLSGVRRSRRGRKSPTMVGDAVRVSQRPRLPSGWVTPSVGDSQIMSDSVSVMVGEHIRSLNRSRNEHRLETEAFLEGMSRDLCRVAEGNEELGRMFAPPRILDLLRRGIPHTTASSVVERSRSGLQLEVGGDPVASGVREMGVSRSGSLQSIEGLSALVGLFGGDLGSGLGVSCDGSSSDEAANNDPVSVPVSLGGGGSVSQTVAELVSQSRPVSLRSVTGPLEPVTRSPIHTRSRGPPEVFPNIQARLVEYKRARQVI